jgi:hypothetical protein
MCSASELQRVSVAAAHCLMPTGTVEIAPGVRGDENEDAEVARQNKQNELQAQGDTSGQH